MPPDEPGVHPTVPPRFCGGNLDCKELVVGTKLFLPIPLDDALFSAGDCHALQGDGEVSSTAIECPLERGELTLTVRDDLELTGPIAWTADAWIALGLGETIDAATVDAVDSMLRLMGRELGLERRDALALASVVVDLRVTQVVNGVLGVHAVLPHGALGSTESRRGVRVQAAGSRRGPDRGRDRSLAGGGGAGDRRGRPAGRGQTDKTTVEIPSPAAGKVARILVAEGDVVPVGTVLVVIGEDGVAPAVAESSREATPRRRGGPGAAAAKVERRR